MPAGCCCCNRSHERNCIIHHDPTIHSFIVHLEPLGGRPPSWDHVRRRGCHHAVLISCAKGGPGIHRKQNCPRCDDKKSFHTPPPVETAKGIRSLLLCRGPQSTGIHLPAQDRRKKQPREGQRLEPEEVACQQEPVAFTNEGDFTVRRQTSRGKASGESSPFLVETLYGS